MAVSILRFLFISTVAVRTAGGECILPHKICRTACLCHRVIQMTHCRREVVQSQLAHQHTDAIAHAGTSRPNSVSADVLEFFSGKDDAESRDYIDLCRQVEKMKKKKDQ